MAPYIASSNKPAFKPFNRRSFLFAPLFWASYVDIADPIPCSGIHAKSSSLVAALYAAIYETPSILTLPCIRTLQIGWIACCSAEGAP